MINKSVDVAVIGGGPAGLASAISAKENGAKKVLVLDRNNWLGGILPQCIHDGFGVEETGTSMTGTEYAEMYISHAKKADVEFLTETMVLYFDSSLKIIAVNKKDLMQIKTNSIILAMGCREKTRWNIQIPGTRPSGIYTAGVAQAFINLYNKIPGKNVLILGSGDVGLIMARRLKFEGANVLGVVEILPYASGLPRNVVQCLDDYDIPLFLHHTVTLIEGKDRLESVTIAQVDEQWNILPETKQKITCDTLLLSLGLIPENELSENVGIKLDELTGGPIVNQFYETNLPGVFACGNCLQVYDTVDVLAKGAQNAGEYAAKKVPSSNKTIKVKPGKGIRHIVPQIISSTHIIHFTLRVKNPNQSVTLKIHAEGNELFSKKLRYVNPANMVEFDTSISPEIFESINELKVFLDE